MCPCSSLTLLWSTGNSPPVFIHVFVSFHPLDVLASVPRHDSSDYRGRVSSWLGYRVHKGFFASSTPLHESFMCCLLFVCYVFLTDRCVWCWQHPNITWHYSRRHTGILYSYFHSWWVSCLLFHLTIVNKHETLHLGTVCSISLLFVFVFLQLGEFFGYALDTADLNNDGYVHSCLHILNWLVRHACRHAYAIQCHHMGHKLLYLGVFDIVCTIYIYM